MPVALPPRVVSQVAPPALGEVRVNSSTRPASFSDAPDRFEVLRGAQPGSALTRNIEAGIARADSLLAKGSPGIPAGAIRAVRDHEQFLLDHGRFGTFNGKDGMSIAYLAMEHPNEKGAVVFLPGRSEPFVKYGELLRHYYDQGYSVYAMDHRGQGASQHFPGDKGNVAHFQDYADDATTFVKDVVGKKPHAGTFAVAHSMGGAILTRVAEEHPKLFDAVVLSSPMHEINTGKWPEPIARAVAWVGSRIGFGDSYAPGQGPAQPTWNFNDYSHNPATYDQSRALNAIHPDFVIGGATFRWIDESEAAGAQSVRDASKLTIPVLLLQAGDDHIVRPGAQDAIVAAAPNARKLVYPTAAHEILQEQPAVRDAAISAIDAFLTAHPHVN